jgi:sugar phosphate isomerase/epimerase
MRYGCVINPEHIGAAIAAGFDYVELPARALDPEGRHDLAIRAISRALAKSRQSVKVEVFSSLLPEDMVVVGPGVDQVRLRRYLRRVFTAMWALGGVQVVLGMGQARRVPEGFSHEQAETQFAEVLSYIAEQADRNGLDLVLNPLNRAETNLLTTLEDCCRFFSAHQVEHIGLLADSYHLLAEEEPEAVADCGALISHVHVADADYQPPGQGGFDLAPFFTTLRALGYDARISLKCNWNDFAEQAGPALAYVRQQWEASERLPNVDDQSRALSGRGLGDGG